MKQVEEVVDEQHQVNTDLDLQYPTIPLYHHLGSLVAHSQVLTMASAGDDSSIDENMSSIEDSVWDVIDEASVVTSDDEDQDLSRQQTPSSDGHDQDSDDKEIPGDADTHDESQGAISPDFRSKQQRTSSAFDKSWTSEVTNFRVPQNLKNEEDNKEPHDQKTILFNKDHMHDASPSESFDAWHFAKVFEGEEKEKICQDFRLSCRPQKIIGTIRQKMSREPLRLISSYKLLYVGPNNAKQPIVQKISAALACSLNEDLANAKSSPSRFSIVPISAFDSGSEPEVVLVNHMGLEICIEECTSASLVREQADSDKISLTMNNNTVVQSAWHDDAFAVSSTYTLPSLAIVFIPENEEAVAKQTRLLARSFIGRHNIPAIVLSDFGWKGPIQSITLDYRTPHFCIEADGLPDQQRVLKRLPIDLFSFLDIEATEMSRNLAYISRTDDNTQPDVGKPTQFGTKVVDAITNRRTTCRDHPTSIGQRTQPTFWSISRLSSTLLLGLLLSTIIFNLVNKKLDLLSKGGSPDPIVMSSLSLSPFPSSTTVPSLPTTSQPVSKARIMEANQPFLTKSLSALHTNTDLASFLLKSHEQPPSTSEKFKLHVIGDCHIILRPPRWLTALKKAPALIFNVARGSRSVDYQFSTLFDGVYALKVAKEDAYGTLNVSVWTVKKPMINETFQVEFGNPWLNFAGWKRATQVVTGQVHERLHSAQTGLTNLYENAGSGIQVFAQSAIDSANYALKEVEKAGMISLNESAKTTDLMIHQSRELLRTFSEQIHRRSTTVTLYLVAQRNDIQIEIASLPQKMSSLLSRQSDIISKAATRLNVVRLANDIQIYRETHLVESQKQALRIWWTIRGGPPREHKSVTDSLPKPRKQKLKKEHKR